MPDRQINAPIEEEMRKSYLDYAMSVIVGRALPDIRDGLKPVHRRVLYTMSLLGLVWNRGYKKSARVVGDCMGKFHPHGDSAIYDTLVRMVQEFSLRYPLVDGQGNFGSIDGDPAAAMRYTEARMARIAHEMLADIDKDTVDFAPNYDDNETEPVVLPTRIPNLLVNGSAGIAVGMATNIPPHNLTEVVNGLVALIERPDTTIEQLAKIITGPDFPTAGYIYGIGGIREAYTTGRGTITLRAKAHAEKLRGGREAIIITELPYQVNKASLIEKISELSREKKIEGISEIRDESNREGIRVVMELGRGEIPQILLNQLYKHTQMQTTFGIIMLALVDRRPQVVNLKEMLEAFIKFRREVVTRRTRYDLARAEERAHILAGLRKAVEQLDLVIRIIRGAANADAARDELMRQLDLSEIQAKAILDMQLRRLAALERQKIIEEHEETLRLIEELKSILASDAKLMAHHQGRAGGGEGGVRRRPPYRDPHRDHRSHDRGPAGRRGDGGHHHPLGLHQAHARRGVPQSAARRQGCDRDGDEGGGHRRGSVRRLDPLLPVVLHQPRQGALAQGPRDPRGGPGGQGQGHGQPPVAGRG